MHIYKVTQYPLTGPLRQKGIVMFYSITFSPTGGTQKIADILSLVLSPEVIQIDLSDQGTDPRRYDFTSQDLCLVAVPSFGGRVPALAAERLAQLKGGGARAILVVSYGNRAYEDTLLELEDILLSAGFLCTAGIAAIAEHSIMHQFAAGRPDNADQKELEAFARSILSKLGTDPTPAPVSLPGSRPYRKYGTIPLVPKTGKSCTECGLCAARCPADAIPSSQPSHTDKKRCISCMRCITICPSHARSLNPLLLAAAVKKLEAACSGRKENQLFL